MQEDKRLHLICRYLSDECTRDEKQAIENWLSEDSNHREYINAVKKVWEVTPNYEVDVDFEEEWRRIRRRLNIDFDEPAGPNVRIDKQNSSHFFKDNPVKYLLRVAAVILLIAISAFYFADFGNRSGDKSYKVEVKMQKIQTARGERASMEFSDGSKIILNSMSTVRFPKAFRGAKRKIYLEGEAFFRIVHNKERPFIVHVNGVAIKDMGTEFNISAYKEDQAVEVVVRDGKVKVKQNKLSRKPAGNSVDGDEERATEVVLTKGQKTIVKTGALPSKPQNVSLKPYLAWVNGRMVFDGTPMREVISRLKRAYNLNFKIQDSTLLSERLGASFNRERPEKVLGIIAFSLGIDYELRGNTVIFKSKN